jgi:hypothetical protein
MLTSYLITCSKHMHYGACVQNPTATVCAEPTAGRYSYMVACHTHESCKWTAHSVYRMLICCYAVWVCCLAHYLQPVPRPSPVGPLYPKRELPGSSIGSTASLQHNTPHVCQSTPLHSSHLNHHS